MVEQPDPTGFERHDHQFGRLRYLSRRGARTSNPSKVPGDLQIAAHDHGGSCDLDRAPL